MWFITGKASAALQYHVKFAYYVGFDKELVANGLKQI